MKKLIFLILIVTLACNTEEKTKITLKSNNSVWNAYQGYHFERELIICGVDSVENIYLENKLNETDEIRSSQNNNIIKYYYSSRPNEAGLHKITGIIEYKNEKLKFEQQIGVFPKPQTIGFNIKNANRLKVGIENEIKLMVSVPSEYLSYNVDNGKLIEKDDKLIVIPKEIGELKIRINADLPSNENIEFSDVIFEVVE